MDLENNNEDPQEVNSMEGLMKEADEQVAEIIESANEEIIGKAKRTKKKQGPRNRDKGHRVERDYAKIFQEAGFKMCKTSRATSRLLDACKIDLNFIPIMLQIKAGYEKGLNPAAILRQMEEELNKNYPVTDPIHKLPRAVLHHKDLPKGQSSRTVYDAMVSMTFKDLLVLVVAFNKQLEYDYQNSQRGD